MGDPWLSIIGLNEDSLAGLPAASHQALQNADVVFGAPRHLELAGITDRARPWPIPFSVDPVLACRGQRVAVLASGDPFWFGAGGSLVKHVKPDEWRSYPSPSTFTLAASSLGWRMEEITCHGLHAVPLARLRPMLAPGARMICLLRDGEAPAVLAEWLVKHDCGAAKMQVMERLGGPTERIRATTADRFDLTDVVAPVAVALHLPSGVGLSRASGLPDDVFAHDGQITKRPVRALTLSALAPRPGEYLWDIGAGSGSISVEWCLAGGRATSFERHASRVPNIAQNAEDLGIGHRMDVVDGDAAKLLAGRPLPDAVFIGGGANEPLLETLFDLLKPGTRLVVNAVTLETESLLARQHAKRGGSLLRIELATAAPLGRMHGWSPARPVVQWSVTL
ncbi:cobalamin biosynthesis bifunctional protein CbiET [Sulfitobacter sp. SK012]|uniref:precorrin-6y C5,15-methyltransferase (decarboxylating) subunit CbiE n=1 Tax=Sulfitobacter sp. SK012 TaxID=1389005 RepID=UPI000E0C4144|nr:precorrin-6y C5,15-methyltransferase (decarboxylating) subunit CbiE [Sulfitobacter sp. SK012]AXI44813.1 cobalamin biosynthesis bifunctional protein CbiET [Sulfitobacter sp. SK012]